MANLRLTIGGVVGARQIDDARAASIADLYYAAVVAPGWPTDTPLPATPQEKLQAVVDAVAKHMLETVREHKRRALRAANEDAERAEVRGISL